MSNWQTVVIGLETQVPYHNRRIWRSFLEFIITLEPDRIVGVGDHLDCPAPSRWNRGTAAEYAGSLQKEIDVMKGMFGELRAIYDGPLYLHEGNHERRINTYSKTKAPAFADLECLSVSNLLAYSSYGILELPAVAHLCPGWVSTHDLGGLSRSVSKIAGCTSLGYARRLGRNVVAGHTHRLGHVQETSHGMVLHGVETGHMMGGADYTSYPNWQSGWVVLEYNNNLSKVTLVNVSKTGVINYS